MEDIQLLDAVERYIRGEMNADELSYFEQLRKSSPDIDQLVVEHSIFLHQLNDFGSRKQFRNHLQETHAQLMNSGAIKEEAPKTKVVDLFKKYRRVWAIAACIAGIIAITMSGLVTYFATPKSNNSQIQQLSRELNNIKIKQNEFSKKLSNSSAESTKAPANADVKIAGTGFLIDGKGYIITNSHVIKNAKTVLVQNAKGQEFNVDVVLLDTERDLAVLKMQDSSFKQIEQLPYGFKKTGAELGEQIFTLGYPRDEIVYGEGYLSAATGYNGDTLSCQIAVAANPGNSGGPVFNKNGEIVGILSTRQLQAQGFVFAVTAKNIFRSLEELKKSDTTYQNIKVNTVSSVKGLDRVQQIKKIEDCVFLVKTY